MPEADPYLDAALDAWIRSNRPLPPPQKSGSQAILDECLIREDKLEVESLMISQRQKATLLAASSPHSGDWLLALPLANCGLRLDDEGTRVGVALRLGLQLCTPHECRCGSQVDAWGSHAMICKSAPGRSSRHQALNDVVARALVAADKPVTKEPPGLMSGSGKRPDGVTQLPWKNGKYLAWDVTVATTLAESYLAASSSHSGSAAELISARKIAKYQGLPPQYSFVPLAFENLGTPSTDSSAFVTELGSVIARSTGDSREASFLWQRISICLQRYNSILLHQSFKESATLSEE